MYYFSGVKWWQEKNNRGDTVENRLVCHTFSTPMVAGEIQLGFMILKKLHYPLS
jgi:hypothetical protein